MPAERPPPHRPPCAECEAPPDRRAACSGRTAPPAPSRHRLACAARIGGLVPAGSSARGPRSVMDTHLNYGCRNELDEVGAAREVWMAGLPAAGTISSPTMRDKRSE